VSAPRQRLGGFCKRTLRNQVTEYIRYTERRPITRPFKPTDDEHALYEAVSGFLQREDSYALPSAAAASDRADPAQAAGILFAGDRPPSTRCAYASRKAERRQSSKERPRVCRAADRLRGDRRRPARRDSRGVSRSRSRIRKRSAYAIDRQKLREEIEILQRLANWARSIGTDTKTQTLLKALDIGFEQMTDHRRARKALMFTESRRTQEYLKAFLESHGYHGQVVLFNGSNGGPEATAIYERWVEKNRETAAVPLASRAVDVRTALIEHFRDEGKSCSPPKRLRKASTCSSARWSSTTTCRGTRSASSSASAAATATVRSTTWWSSTS
jgi:hypothetical protein